MPRGLSRRQAIVRDRIADRAGPVPTAVRSRRSQGKEIEARLQRLLSRDTAAGTTGRDPVPRVRSRTIRIQIDMERRTRPLRHRRERTPEELLTVTPTDAEYIKLPRHGAGRAVARDTQTELRGALKRQPSHADAFAAPRPGSPGRAILATFLLEVGSQRVWAGARMRSCNSSRRRNRRPHRKQRPRRPLRRRRPCRARLPRRTRSTRSGKSGSSGDSFRRCCATSPSCNGGVISSAHSTGWSRGALSSSGQAPLLASSISFPRRVEWRTRSSLSRGWLSSPGL